MMVVKKERENKQRKGEGKLLLICLYYATLWPREWKGNGSRDKRDAIASTNEHVYHLDPSVPLAVRWHSWALAHAHADAMRYAFRACGAAADAQFMGEERERN